jgi:bifunctional DNA-binding transcriptional regulator/antitoxin component of YhaV-PrlF toxin-antitoxin module
MVTRVTGKNQVTIPAALARQLGIVPCTKLDWRKGDEANTISILVKPSVDAMLREVQELGAPYRVKAKEMLEDLNRMREEDDPEYGAGEGPTP